MNTDIVIIGAGPVGAATALALRAQGSTHSIAVLDAGGPQLSAIERTLALSYGARLLLEQMEVWPRLAASATPPSEITQIDVTQAEAAGHAVITAQASGVPALGYVTRYAALKTAMDDALCAAGIHVTHHAKAQRVSVDPTCATVHLDGLPAHDGALVIVADGGGLALPGMKSFKRDHGQSAVVAHVRVSTPAPGCAFERFTNQGPIALLPLDAHDTFGLVWTHAHAAAPAVCALPAATFCAQAAAAFGDRLGSFTLLNTPRFYPLGLTVVEPRVSPRIVAVGNAAQAMHPIAGQGLNLGLRDAWKLAEMLAKVPSAQFSAPGFLTRYALARARDRVGGIVMTEGLVGIFGLESRLAQHARGAAIAGFDAVAPLKRAVARRMMFGA